MRQNVLTKKQQYSVVILSVALSLFIVWAGVFGATTISTNITTDGTLSVTGAATLSSTLVTSGLATTTGMHELTDGFLSKASSTVASTLYVAGTITSKGNVIVNSLATTTATTGAFGTMGGVSVGTSTSPIAKALIVEAKMGIGTTTPAFGSASSSLSISSSATGTVYVSSDTATFGGCIQMLSASGSVYKMYIGSTDSGTSTRGKDVGSIVGALIAFWQPGSCQTGVGN